MASTYNPQTAHRIHSAIAESDSGLNVEQLIARTELAKNTILIYTRKLAAQGAIEVQKDTTHGTPNIYVSLAPPKLESPEQQRLKQIAEILQPYSKHPESWHKAYKGEIIHAIQEALKLT